MASSHKIKFKAIVKALRAISKEPHKAGELLPKIKNAKRGSVFFLSDDAVVIGFSQQRLKTVVFGEDFYGVRILLSSEDSDGDPHIYDATLDSSGVGIQVLDGVGFDE